LSYVFSARPENEDHERGENARREISEHADLKENDRRRAEAEGERYGI